MASGSPGSTREVTRPKRQAAARTGRSIVFGRPAVPCRRPEAIEIHSTILTGKEGLLRREDSLVTACAFGAGGVV